MIVPGSLFSEGGNMNIISILFKAGTIFGRISALYPNLQLQIWIEPDLTLHIEQKDMIPEVIGYSTPQALLDDAEKLLASAKYRKQFFPNG